MSELTIDARTEAQQALAADPAHTVWVSANAGSGKTHVLTNRVVRLLLEGAEPSKILCLTFTKTAAAQMSNKVFDQLGQWALMQDQDLTDALEKLEGTKPAKGRRDLARRLFARALETPGGLNIQTIHAFCERILHRFPLEANVPGHFQVMDDTEQTAMVEAAREETQLEAVRDPDGDIATAWNAIMGAASDSAFDRVLEDIVKDRERFVAWSNAHGTEAAVRRAVRITLGISDNETPESVLDKLADEFRAELDDWRRLCELCGEAAAEGSMKLAEALRPLLRKQDGEAILSALVLHLLTQKGAVRSTSRFPDKVVKASWPGVETWLTSWGEQILAYQNWLKAHHTVDNTAHLVTFARAMLARFEEQKRRRGLLDYNDLIEQTANLLTRREARSWVLYKLDMGIDHVLVDEAQDTSPRQWDVIRALVEEFFSGDTARDVERTMFAVGDEKQSIYSFQGARPAMFDTERKNVARLSDNALKESKLTLSFRSATDVLDLVDHVFAVPGQSKGLSATNDTVSHAAARREAVGCVDLWPLANAEKSEEEEDWEKPSGQDRHQAIILAHRVADTIKTWVDEGRYTAGDIVVLVRSRDRFVPALTRTLKDRGIAVGGADRLKLTDHIAVLDLLALGRALTLPQDDLAFAALLKSPLLELTEEDLYALSRGRLEDPSARQTLYDHLMAQPNARFKAAQTALSDWTKLADSVPVYEFYARILAADGARKRYYARFGYEVEDVLDAFLRLTLNHETSGQPGLTAFLDHVEHNAPEIKREMEQASSDVRIMTVHAAKGLEAPVVFLVDRSSRAYEAHHQSHLRTLAGPGAESAEAGYVWIPSSDDEVEQTRAAKAHDQALAEQEYRRLLYVGMTRAKDHLVVCGYRGASDPPELSWHNMVSNGFARAAEDDARGSVTIHSVSPDPNDANASDGPQSDSTDQTEESFTFQRWRSADVEGRRSRQTRRVAGAPDAQGLAPQPVGTDTDAHRVPDWFGQPVTERNPRLEPLTASSTTGSARERRSALDGDGGEEVKPEGWDPREKGVAIHKLLEILPTLSPENRAAMATAHLKNSFPSLAPDRIQDGVRDVLAVLNDRRLEGCFDPETSRAEVSLAGSVELGGNRRPVLGIIDRLAVFEDRVVVMDYKTGGRTPATAEDVPTVYQRQMALYCEVLKTIYPNRRVEAWLIWTGGAAPVILTLDEELLSRSLETLAPV